MRAIVVITGTLTVGFLIGGMSGGLLIVGAFVLGALLMFSNVRALGEEQPREEVGVGRSDTPRRPPSSPADANIGAEA